MSVLNDEMVRKVIEQVGQVRGETVLLDKTVVRSICTNLLTSWGEKSLEGREKIEFIQKLATECTVLYLLDQVSNLDARFLSGPDVVNYLVERLKETAKGVTLECKSKA